MDKNSKKLTPEQMDEAFESLEDGMPLFDLENATEEEKQAILKKFAEFSNYDEDIPEHIQEEWHYQEEQEKLQS